MHELSRCGPSGSVRAASTIKINWSIPICFIANEQCTRRIASSIVEWTYVRCDAACGAAGAVHCIPTEIPAVYFILFTFPLHARCPNQSKRILCREYTHTEREIVDYRVTWLHWTSIGYGVADFLMVATVTLNSPAFYDIFSAQMFPLKLVDNFSIFEWMDKKAPCKPKIKHQFNVLNKRQSKYTNKINRIRRFNGAWPKHAFIFRHPEFSSCCWLARPRPAVMLLFLVQCIHFVRSARETSLSWIACCCEFASSRSPAHRNKISECVIWVCASASSQNQIVQQQQKGESNTRNLKCRSVRMSLSSAWHGRALEWASINARAHVSA